MKIKSKDKYKTFELTGNIKTLQVNDDNSIITIEGYASTSEIDRDGDVILPDAWTTDGGLDNYKNNPIILFNHRYDEPIGKAIELTIDDIGLKMRAEIYSVAGKVFDIIKSGILQTFSVGFRIKDAEFREETMGFIITDAELFEVSVVSVPANAGATFSVAKSFETDEEFQKFKKEITKVDLADQSLPGSSDKSREIPKVSKEKLKMDENELKQFAADLVAKMAKSTADQRAEEKAEEKAETAKAAAEKAAEKAAATKAEEDAKTIITTTMSGAEKLINDLEKRHLEKAESLESLVAELKEEIKEKGAEMTKIHESKRLFDDRGGNGSWKKEFSKDVDNAYVLGIATNKNWQDTKFGAGLSEKVNTWSGVQVSSADYEQLVSTNIERDIQLELVLAPMFREVEMNSASMIFPVLPDAGYAEFASAQTASGSSPHGNLAERGDTYGSPYGGIDLTERTVTTKKLISQSYLANETEEDAIMPILPLIRESMVRSHSRAIENMVLTGNHADGAFGTGGASPDGLVKIADDKAQQSNDGASGFLAADKITSSDLLTIRRNMGKYAVNPSDIVYVVSLDVYYDLLEDAEFQDINLVGDLSTKVTGVVGTIFGSKVIVCPEFAAKAAAKFCAVGVNVRNFFIPRLRGFTVESDNEVANQRRVIVMSQRIGFTDVVVNHATNTPSVWGFQYKLTT